MQVPRTRNSPGIFPVAALIFLFILPHLILAQNALSLKDCLHLAFGNSRRIKMADIAVEQSKEQIGESKAQRLPSFGLNAVYTRVGKVTSFTIPMGNREETFRFGTSNRLNFDAKLQWSAFTWGRISNTIAISRVGKEMSATQKKSDRVSTTDQLLRAFFSVLLNERIIQLDEESVARAENLTKITEERYSAGGIPQLELLRNRVQLKNSESLLEEAKGNLKKSQLLLANIIGQQDGTPVVKGELEFRPVTADEQEIIERALAVRSDLNILQLQKEISLRQVNLAGSGNKPNVILFSGYNVVNGFDPTNPDKLVDNWNAGVQIAIPLFDGFATSHKVQNAKLAVQRLDLQEQEIRDLIRLQVKQAFTTLRQAESKIATQEENIGLAKEALQVAEDQYRYGIVSSLDVLNANQTLSQSETMHLQAIFNHIMAKLELARAMEDYSWFEPDLKP